MRVLHSCSSHWMFDGVTHRFCRMPRESVLRADALTEWAPYERLEIDEFRSCFVVVLDDAGTRSVRAWLHVDPCDRCCPDLEKGVR